MKETFQLAGNAAAIYEDQKVPAIFRPLARATLDVLTLREDEKVLDVACGTGIVGREIASRLGSNGHVTGVDLNEGMIDVARRLTDGDADRFEWHVADVCDLPFTENAFSLAICQQGLQFFPDEMAALKEVHRVLMPDGRIALTVWVGPNDLFKVLAEALSRHVSDEIGQRSLAPFTYAGFQSLPDRVSQAGFGDIAVQTLTVVREVSEPESNIPKEIMGNPVGPSVAERGPEIMSQIVRDVMEGMTDYQDGDKLAVPQQASLMTATVCS